MVSVTFMVRLVAAFAVAGPVLAHPGHDLTQEIAERAAYLRQAKRDLSHCGAKMDSSGLTKRINQRRQESVEKLKIRKRTPVAQAANTTPVPSGAAPSGVPSGSGGLGGSGGPGGAGPSEVSLSPYGSAVANLSHESNLTLTPWNPLEKDLIYGNKSCVLNPEGIVRPYYVTGEYIRSDISEGQDGVPLFIDAQFVNVNTCEPIEALYLDIWHCNATGVYAGVVANGNGNSKDLSNVNKTFMRGIQPTDSDGTLQFQTIFPGHYTGRATHIHVASHMNGTIFGNGTYRGGNITQNGQFFFDQTLLDQVYKLSPYDTSTAEITKNVDDMVFASEAVEDSDPVFNWVQLDDDLEDGVFAWVTVGVDPDARYEASAVADYGENGGVQNNDNSGMP